MMWDLDQHGRCRIMDSVRTLFSNPDGSEKADSIARFYGQLRACQILDDIDNDDSIN